MKSRIRKDGGFWIGEVYGTWSMFFGVCERVGWECVTEKCYTRFGAKRQLIKWKEQNSGFEVEI